MDLAANRDYARALALGFGGALLFALPLLMTMEMWRLGFVMEPGRLLALVLASLPMLLGLSYFAGFEPTFRLKDEVLDMLAALGVGLLLSAAVLSLFGALRLEHAWTETTGKIALCAIPGAMGALLAGKQFGERDLARTRTKARTAYGGELFTVAVGALFLAFNIAPTEEVPQIARQMGPFRSLLLLAVTLLLSHVIVYRLGFPGQDVRRGSGGIARTFVFFTIPAYAISFLISACTLWSFGRLDGLSVTEINATVLVLAFPAAIGAATARLVI